jgi:glutamine amidotransferase PdxT
LRGLILLAKRRRCRADAGSLDITAQATRGAAMYRHRPSGAPLRELPGVFIRARASRGRAGRQVIATFEGSRWVCAGPGRATFHPELSADARLHAWFLREVAGLGAKGSAAR